MSLKVKILTIVVAVAIAACAGYLWSVWPRNYSYSVNIKPDAISVSFNRPVNVRTIYITKVKRVMKQTDSGYSFSVTDLAEPSVLSVVSDQISSFSLSVPKVENDQVRWEKNPIKLEPGNSYMGGWELDQHIFGFDMHTTGAMHW